MNPLKNKILKLILLWLIVTFPLIGSSQAMGNSLLEDVRKVFAASYEAPKGDFNTLDLNNLPSMFSQTVANMKIMVAVNSAEFYKDHTQIEVYMKIDMPAKGKSLFFAGNDIKLSHDGDIIGDARVSLLQDVRIPITGNTVALVVKGGFNEQTGATPNLTHASIDCKGLKELGLIAEVELSPDLCTPAFPEDGISSGGRVVGEIKTQVETFDDIVAEVSFPAFQIKGLKDFVWSVQSAVFDFSDSKNASGLVFPQGYEQYLVNPGSTLWQGIYIRELMLTLPPQFSDKKQSNVSFLAQDMIIDDNGFSGKIGGSNILSFDEGNASGWAFSVDYFGLSIMANQLEGAEFSGKVGLPISTKAELAYEGLITSDDRYVMQVAMDSTLTIPFDMLHAEAKLHKNSYIEFKVKDNQFHPEAMLHGCMSINVPKSSNENESLAKIENVDFRSLHLKTENPYLTVEYLGYSGEVSFANFPASISNISLTANQSRASLGLDLSLTLSDGMFAGSTRLAINGSLEDGASHRWKYDGIDTDAIKVDATIAGTFSLAGEVNLYEDDPIYGNAFGGAVRLAFLKGGPIGETKVEARAMFGRTSYRYWFVDGVADFGSVGIPIPPALSVNSFGGGVAYRMSPSPETKNTSPLSATDMVYVPDENASLRIKSSIEISIARLESGRGSAAFELAFNKKGGLSYAGFFGSVEFAPDVSKYIGKAGNLIEGYNSIVRAEKEYIGNNPQLVSKLAGLRQYNATEAAELTLTPKQREELKQDGLRATMGILFNFDESTFHANFELYANLAGGTIRGVGTGGRAGHCVLHIAPQEWYVHMGTPEDRVGLQFGLGNILSVKTTSYLMLGTNIPAAPQIPQQLADILGETPSNLNYMKDLNAIGEGRGFAFGSNMSVNTGDITFLILYANYNMGMGFDVMLKDYGDIQCKGRSGAIGINGWYANGQAYAYMNGELGVKVNLRFLKAKVPIISADFGALMQAKLPNPTSFKAYIAARAKVLGLINVNCRFKLVVGDECELVIPGGSPVEMAMISDLTPTSGSTDVSVFTAPQARFNMEIGKAFDVQDDEGDKRYRIQLKEFVLNDGSDIIGELKWSNNKDALSFYSHEILPPEKTVTATVSVRFEEWKNGRWSVVYTSGKEALETKTVSFKTGDAPVDIPLENIAYSYPVVNQQYYLRDESNKAYVQLNFGQEYLFPSDMSYRVEFEEEASGKTQSVAMSYDAANKRVNFASPSIGKSKSYTLRLIALAQSSTSAGGNSTESLLDTEDGGNISVDSRKASLEVRDDIGATLLDYNFKSSAYNTLKQKIDNIKKTTATATVLSSDLLMLGYETKEMEPFDKAELTGVQYTNNKPLVDVEAALTDYFFKQKINPLLYEDYPVDGRVRVKRGNVDEIGLPPTRALPIKSDYLSSIKNEQYTGLVTRNFPYYYNLPYVYKQDFIDIQSQVINGYIKSDGTSWTAYEKFSKARFPFISSEKYRIYMQYILPDGTKGSRASFDFYNFVK